MKQSQLGKTMGSSVRLRWPLLVLMSSIGLTAFAAFDAQRAVRGQNRVVNRAVTEFSSFAAWSYSEHLKQHLTTSAAEVIGAVNHGDDMHTNARIPEADELAHYLPTDGQCDCHRTRFGPNPAAFFGFKLGNTVVDVARNVGALPHESWPVDASSNHLMPPVEVYTEEERRWIADTLTAHVRTASMGDHGFGLVVGRFEGRTRPITYTLMPTSWGDTMVYGVEYLPSVFQGVLTRVLEGKGLLPATFTRGQRNRDVVAMRILDGSGGTIYESAPGVRSPAHTELRLPPEFGAMTVNAMIRPDQAASLIIGGTPRSRLPFLLGLLALAAALSVVAIAQIRRETELARMRADFVSSISHELRTPLAQIRLYLETLRLGRASTPEQRAWSLDHMDRETTRLSNLVENVLRFSRLGRGDEPASRTIDLGDEIENIVDEFRPLAATRKASIELEVNDNPLVMMTPECLRHIVVNLLDNAVKYGPASQTITVEVSRRAEEAVIAVSDEGSGVPPGERDRIWRPFTRAQTSTGAAGSGIGLTIVRDVVTRHGGRAGIEDAKGGGARFVITIPASQASSPPAQNSVIR